MHRRQVPDVADDGPGSHHHVDVGEHAILGAVPEGFSKLDVIFDGHRPNGSTDLKRSLLELHDAGVVDASPLRKYQDWQLVWVLHVLLQSLKHSCPVLRLTAIEPNLSRGFRQSCLQISEKAAMLLASLKKGK